MTKAQTALARRAVACKGWRWMRGMRACGCGDSGVVTNVWCDLDTHQTTDIFVSYDEECRSRAHAAPDYDQCLPDLTDAATIGCLLALVREAHGDPVLFARFRGARVHPDWVVSWDGSDVIATGATEAEALVAALESAP
jgi:hypothetical protein